MNAPIKLPESGPMRGSIILLNGASSAGKSTLAQALQARLPGPFWHYSIDHLLAANILPRARIDSGEFAWSRLREPFFEGFHGTLPVLAAAGNHLVVEHIVDVSGLDEPPGSAFVRNGCVLRRRSLSFA